MKFESVDLSKLTKPKRLVNKIFLHCSASDNPLHDDSRVIEKWHVERGFTEIGYHFFITKSGDIQEGRSLEKRPAAQKNRNLCTIAICCHGLDKELFTHKQKISLRALCIRLYDLLGGIVTFHGHCEVDSGRSCPVFPYKDWLDLDENGRMKLSK